MRSFAICGTEMARLQPLNGSIRTLEIERVPVTCGIVSAREPVFDPGRPEAARRVLVRVRAFSCNYRDRAQIFKMALRGPADGFYPIGSDFVGEVVAAGPGVSRVRAGDRVIGDNAYPSAGGLEPRGGIPANGASRELLLLDEAQVVPVPESMPDEVAAGFSIGAQTAYSMARKLALPPGARVLVTAARSNTSLFAIAALRRHGAEVYATTTSAEAGARLAALGVRETFRVGAEVRSFAEHEGLRETARALGGFDAVVDPFFDLHLRRTLPLLAFGGRYVTCGFHDQHLALLGTAAPERTAEYAEALQIALVKNLQLIGNCLGERTDLERALEDHAAGRLRVLVDSSFGGDDTAAFLHRTYCAPDRTGKVVFRYP